MRYLNAAISLVCGLLAQAWLDERADDSAAYREFGGRSGAYTPPQTRSGSAYGPVGSEM